MSVLYEMNKTFQKKKRVQIIVLFHKGCMELSALSRNLEETQNHKCVTPGVIALTSRKIMNNCCFLCYFAN